MTKGGQTFRGGFAEFQRQAMRIQRRLEELQEEMKTRQQEAVVGGGKVKAVVSGAKEVVSIQIDPEVIKPDDAVMLQDLVVSAVNAALRKVDEMIDEETNKVTGGLKIPGLT
ncbi:MAG: YbaB/EbfC family nucleoid-associated protein [Deltaproteobacteria bacterium]|nr:YbaB/EbfC family nucleoid-associated protein [Deltaproteobacteria bacterium]